MTGAERAKRRREKLKATSKHDEYKKKQAEIMRANRAKKKESEDNMNLTDAHAVIMKRREATRQRVAQYRARKSNPDNVPIENQSHNSSLSGIVSEVYSCSQTLGKAVKKVTNALPASPRRKKAVLTHIVSNLDQNEKETLINVVAKPKFARKSIPTALNTEIRKYFERDDISRASPKVDDVEKYKCPETGEELLLPKRHMVLSLKEAHALFVQELKSKGAGMIAFIAEYSA